VNRNLAIASTNIKTNSGNKQLSIVGPTRMNYQQIQGLLDFIKANIEEMQK
jgi:heat-inducible transcriptional repressor